MRLIAIGLLAERFRIYRELFVTDDPAEGHDRSSHPRPPGESSNVRRLPPSRQRVTTQKPLNSGVPRTVGVEQYRRKSSIRYQAGPPDPHAKTVLRLHEVESFGLAPAAPTNLFCAGRSLLFGWLLRSRQEPPRVSRSGQVYERGFKNINAPQDAERGTALYSRRVKHRASPTTMRKV